MPIGRSAGYLPQIGEGWEALDPQTVARDKLDGFAVVDGLEVTTDGTDLTLDVSAGTATVGESSGTVQTVSLGSAGTVTLDQADSTDPRKDTIYIDTNGDLQAETGTAESALPSGNTRFTTYQPESPLPSTEGTVLARVWVGAGVTSIQSADIDDLRVPADTVADGVTAQSVSTDDLRTAPTGTLAQLNGNQTFADATQTEIAWATETSRGSVSGLVNATNNVVVVPSGYDYATAQLHIRMGSEVPIDLLEVTLNGSPSTYLGTGRLRSDISAEYIGISSGWFSVSQGDEIGAILQQSSGGPVDLIDANATYLEVRLL
jgi:hypothetical protein